MRLLIDTNVVLDVLLRRPPFFEAAAAVLKLCDRDNVQEYISASAFTDIYYIASRQLKDKVAVRNMLSQLLRIVSVAAVSEQEIIQALALEWNDFEDSVQYSVALLGSMDGIVTRNSRDFNEEEIPVWTPEEVVRRLNDM
ncbi:MAG: PIN domain-containing protein [Lachnospiraceae bacterium]|nr:PIN domain-containing protein [Lachnospiraceae bacterium]